MRSLQVNIVYILINTQLSYLHAYKEVEKIICYRLADIIILNLRLIYNPSKNYMQKLFVYIRNANIMAIACI